MHAERWRTITFRRHKLPQEQSRSTHFRFEAGKIAEMLQTFPNLSDYAAHWNDYGNVNSLKSIL